MSPVPPSSRQPMRGQPTMPAYAAHDRRSGPTVPGPRAPQIPRKPTGETGWVRVVRQPKPQILSVSQRMRAIQSRQADSLASPARNGKPALRKRGRSKASTWVIAVLLGLVSLGVFTCMAVAVGVGLIYQGGVLPGVSAAGIDLGGLSQQEAAERLATRWNSVTLRDGERTWVLNRESLGLFLNANATAERAYQQGRGEGSPLQAILGSAEIAPVVSLDEDLFRDSLEDFTGQVDIPAVNAGVRFVDGRVEPAPPRDGRILDIEATLARLERGGQDALAQGSIDLVTVPVQPAVTDVTPVLDEAAALLAHPLAIRIYDPVTGDIVNWTQPPEQWSSWLSALPDSSRPSGMALWVQQDAVRAYLTAQSNVFDSTRYLDMEEAVEIVQQAVREGNTRPTLRVHHHDRQHVVQQGDTIVSVAWDYGVPYPWLQQANPGVNTLSIGQTITIPSPDNFLPYPVVPDKRIVVSISQQRAWIYENGSVIWEWPISTGINDSPTWPGIYQVISHEQNAYAGNWNLWMPYFMGVYQPIPNTDFTNGFHGFPTRGGGQLLWENSLGRRVTYGCILLSTTNARTLYEWAQEGVVVEIQT